MQTKERSQLSEANPEYLNRNNHIIRNKKVNNDEKPKMYLKVRALLSTVSSDLSTDIIINKGE